MRWALPFVFLLTLSSCHPTNQPAIDRRTDEAPVQPVIVSQPVRYDTDDPAIWIHPDDPSQSLIIGTDKDENGALYVFDLEGNIIESRVVRHLRRPNNVDVAYGLELGGASVDIAVVTERLKSRIRVFALPEMTAIDKGGIGVFEGETTTEYRAPMGIALYRRAFDGAIFAIVGRKNGPENGYLWQYRLKDDGTGNVEGILVRKFGAFGGVGEIEAIAVDHPMGYVYYADEQTGIRKYYADPRKGNRELSLFGTEGFTEDREGISICPTVGEDGFILVSNQQANSFNVYNRQGPPDNPHHHTLVREIRVSATESDGSEVSLVPFNKTFSRGLFVAMSDDRTFHYYRLEDVLGDLLD